MLQISELARGKILKMTDANKGKYLRISSKGFGWCGANLAIALDELKDNEKPLRINGVDILIDDSAVVSLDGWTIESDRDGFIFAMSVEAWCRMHNYTD